MKKLTEKEKWYLKGYGDALQRTLMMSAKMIVKILTRNDNKWADDPREYHQWTSVRERREGKWGKYSTPKKEKL